MLSSVGIPSKVRLKQRTINLAANSFRWRDSCCLWEGNKTPSDIRYERYYVKQGTSGSEIVTKLDKQTITSKFESHWMPHSYVLVPHLSKLQLQKPPNTNAKQNIW